MAKMSISRSMRAPPIRDCESVRRFKTGDFPTFTDALQSYTRELQLSTAGLPLGLAVAGVTGGDVVTLANCRWYISVSGLKSFLANPPVLINDFSAIAWSLAGVDVSRLKRIGMMLAEGDLARTPLRRRRHRFGPRHGHAHHR